MLSFVIFAYARASMFGTMCAYVPFVFGFKHFGKLWGSMELVGGLVSLVVPYVDDMINEHSLITVNIIFTALAVMMCLFPVWMRLRSTMSKCRQPQPSRPDQEDSLGYEVLSDIDSLLP